MAKIDFPDGGIPFFNPLAYTGVKKEDKKLKTREKGPLFGRLLESEKKHLEQEALRLENLQSLEASEETLQTLLDEVHQAGDELKLKPLPENIKKYRASVQTFLHYIVQNSYTAAEQDGVVRRNKFTREKEQKKFTLVQVIDRKLEQLAAEILMGQKSQLDILAKVDEINGLLVDLTL